MDDVPGPELALVMNGDILYSTSINGSDLFDTNIINPIFYSIHKDGSNFKIIYRFSNLQGESPSGNIALVGNRFYGTSQFGGVNDLGAIYSLSLSVNCFDSSTNIRCWLNNEEADLPISELNSNSLVKTYCHGYQKIEKIHCVSFRNSKIWYSSMYILPKNINILIVCKIKKLIFYKSIHD